ncbi:MAG: hypothetical protein QOE86_1316 [Solirubrobacteraceae bacterium]|nr:hypothetical protein [Solirubrobacteraceae bacterium]
MADPVVAYVVLCHHKAGQALRLARTIGRSSPRARVLLRHDRPPADYIDTGQAAAAGADLLVSSITGRWGHWSLVAAALEAFRHVRDLHDPDWTVLVSGQDYPVRPLGPWEEALLDGPDDAIAGAEPLVTGHLGRRFRSPDDLHRMRYTHRWHWLPRLGVVPRLPRIAVRAGRAVWYRHLYDRQAVIVLNELPRGNGWALGVRRRRVPWTPATPALKGEQWVALSRAAVAAAAVGPAAERWQRYFARTLIPDEAYFPTVLADAGLRVRDDGVAWLRWHESIADPHPVVVGEAELEQAVASGRPFARKFDEDVHPGLLDVVDRRLLGLPASVAA